MARGVRFPISVLWRRCDTPGHDACRMDTSGAGIEIKGAAVFQFEGEPSCISYRVLCDGNWSTCSARLDGFARGAIDIAIERNEKGDWCLNGRSVDDVRGLPDLDLGFTPATNVIPIRRLSLRIGEVADATAAWLDPRDWTLKRLRQRFERRGEQSFWYEAPDVGYAALLTVDAAGMVRDYPGLWQAVGDGGSRPVAGGEASPVDVDADLVTMVPEMLRAEVQRLRAGIRAHRDSSGHDLCWHHPNLWGLLPEPIPAKIAVPAWPQFLRGCVKYRESLDRELPQAPRTQEDFESG